MLLPDDASRGALPVRYNEEWGIEFWERVNQALQPGACVLDIGAGRRPTVAPEERPDGVHYIGLDVSESELGLAPQGSYDEVVVADAHMLVPSLVGRLDLIVAWQVFEHFRDLRAAASVFHQYTKPGGVVVACFSGRHAVFAIVNRLLPNGMGSRVTERLMRRPRDTIFPAYYDHCDARGLEAAFSEWESLEIIPLWRGADYFRRLRPLRGAYLRYEDWAVNRRMDNLATHYVIAARSAGA
jgi:SAM-dependent methyltransferase